MINCSSIKQQPNTQRGADRCAILFGVATELFLEHGYDHVSLDQIVEHAGGSKATIYKYFGSKKGLFLAICQDRSNKFIHQIELICQPNDLDIRQNLSTLLLNLYSIFADDKSSAFGRLIVLIAHTDQDLAQQLYNFGPNRAHAILADFLSLAHQNKQLYCENPYDSSVYFFGFFHDIHWRTMVGLPFLDLPKVKIQIEYFVERFLQGHQIPAKSQ